MFLQAENVDGLLYIHTRHHYHPQIHTKLSVNTETADRSGCCSEMNRRVADCSGGSFGEISYGYGMSKVERIMLKFRPIAPKPMSAGSGSSCSTVEHGNGYGGNKRRKRKYVRVNGNKNKKDSKTTVSKKQKGRRNGVTDPMVTLSLMPETPDRNENSPEISSENRDPLSSVTRDKPASPVLLSYNNYDHHTDDHAVGIALQQKTIVTSLVTMERVTETWMTSDGVGITDQARVKSMDMDTCPSFITDIRDTVVWTNKSYWEMIVGGDSDETGSLVVVKKFNRVTMPVAHPAFTCTVKVTWGAASLVTITAPCDVWRLRSGGYAWRLDVKAALCLGRYS